jgi:hypothetical protein
MAGDKEDEVEEEEEDQEKPELSADAQKQANALDSITDFVEDKETATKVDVKEVEERLKELRKKQDEMDKKRQEKEKEHKERTKHSCVPNLSLAMVQMIMLE